MADACSFASKELKLCKVYKLWELQSRKTTEVSIQTVSQLQADMEQDQTHPYGKI
jgi:hypothetical protein